VAAGLIVGLVAEAGVHLAARAIGWMGRYTSAAQAA
jgi:hypothetical protein